MMNIAKKTNFIQKGISTPVDFFVEQILGDKVIPLGELLGMPNNDMQKYIVKVEDPATNVLMGSIRFIKACMLPGHQRAVNFQNTGIINMTTDDYVITVQKSQPTINTDVMLFGKAHRQPIGTHELTRFSEKSQWDLANAMFAASAAGLGSLTFSQFKTTTNHHLVTSIMLNDLGSKDVFGIGDDHYLTLDHNMALAYENTTGSRTDFIATFLQASSFKRKYLALWARKLNVNAIVNKLAAILREELNRLTPKLQQKAIDELLLMLTNQSNGTDKAIFERTQALSFAQKRKVVIDHIKSTTTKRMQHLQQLARAELLDIIKQQYIALNSSLCDWGQEFYQRLCATSDFTSVKDLARFKHYLNSQMANVTGDQAQHLQKIAAIILTRQHLAQSENIAPATKRLIDRQLTGIKQIHRNLSLIADLNSYLTEAPNLSESVTHAIDNLRQGKSPTKVINESLKQVVLQTK